LEIESFPNLGLCGTDEDRGDHYKKTEVEVAVYDYESPVQRSWREKMEHYYE